MRLLPRLSRLARRSRCFPPFRLSGLLAPVCLVLTTAAAQAGSPVRLGPAPVLGGGEYSTGGGITVAVDLRDWGGKTGLCGVWAESERLTVYVRNKGKRVLAKGSITLDGRVLTHNLNFLRRVPPAASYAGAPAGCVRLDRPWRPGDANRRLQVRLPRQELFFARNGDRGGGLRITFGPSESANPALLSGSLLPRRWTSVGSISGTLD